MFDFSRQARSWSQCFGAALLLSVCWHSPARAVIETLTTLDKFVADADLILVANVKQLELEQGRLLLAVESRLKGEDAAATVPVKLAGNAREALAGVSQGDRVVLFVSRGQQQSLAFGYTGGVWFHLTGSQDQDKVRWQFKAGEPYLRRTYADETAKLIDLLTANIARTRGLPAPDTTIPPGYGLVPGKHSTLPNLSSPNLTASPASIGGDTPAAFPVNLPLTIAAAGCAIALVVMLTRSVPLENGDG